MGDSNEFGKTVLIHVVPCNLGYFLISSNKAIYLILFGGSVWVACFFLSF